MVRKFEGFFKVVSLFTAFATLSQAVPYNVLAAAGSDDDIVQMLATLSKEGAFENFKSLAPLLEAGVIEQAQINKSAGIQNIDSQYEDVMNFIKITQQLAQNTLSEETVSDFNVKSAEYADISKSLKETIVDMGTNAVMEKAAQNMNLKTIDAELNSDVANVVKTALLNSNDPQGNAVTIIANIKGDAAPSSSFVTEKVNALVSATGKELNNFSSNSVSNISSAVSSFSQSVATNNVAHGVVLQVEGAKDDKYYEILANELSYVLEQNGVRNVNHGDLTDVVKNVANMYNQMKQLTYDPEKATHEQLQKDLQSSIQKVSSATQTYVKDSQAAEFNSFGQNASESLSAIDNSLQLISGFSQAGAESSSTSTTQPSVDNSANEQKIQQIKQPLSNIKNNMQNLGNKLSQVNGNSQEITKLQKEVKNVIGQINEAQNKINSDQDVKNAENLVKSLEQIVQDLQSQITTMSLVQQAQQNQQSSGTSTSSSNGIAQHISNVVADLSVKNKLITYMPVLGVSTINIVGNNREQISKLTKAYDRLKSAERDASNRNILTLEEIQKLNSQELHSKLDVNQHFLDYVKSQTDYNKAAQEAMNYNIEKTVDNVFRNSTSVITMDTQKLKTQLKKDAEKFYQKIPAYKIQIEYEKSQQNFQLEIGACNELLQNEQKLLNMAIDQLAQKDLSDKIIQTDSKTGNSKLQIDDYIKYLEILKSSAQNSYGKDNISKSLESWVDKDKNITTDIDTIKRTLEEIKIKNTINLNLYAAKLYKYINTNSTNTKELKEYENGYIKALYDETMIKTKVDEVAELAKQCIYAQKSYSNNQQWLTQIINALKTLTKNNDPGFNLASDENLNQKSDEILILDELIKRLKVNHANVNTVAKIGMSARYYYNKLTKMPGQLKDKIDIIKDAYQTELPKLLLKDFNILAKDFIGNILLYRSNQTYVFSKWKQENGRYILGTGNAMIPSFFERDEIGNIFKNLEMTGLKEEEIKNYLAKIIEGSESCREFISELDSNMQLKDVIDGIFELKNSSNLSSDIDTKYYDKLNELKGNIQRAQFNDFASELIIKSLGILGATANSTDITSLMDEYKQFVENDMQNISSQTFNNIATDMTNLQSKSELQTTNTNVGVPSAASSAAIPLPPPPPVVKTSAAIPPPPPPPVKTPSAGINKTNTIGNKTVASNQPAIMVRVLNTLSLMAAGASIPPPPPPPAAVPPPPAAKKAAPQSSGGKKQNNGSSYTSKKYDENTYGEGINKEILIFRNQCSIFHGLNSSGSNITSSVLQDAMKKFMKETMPETAITIIEDFVDFSKTKDESAIKEQTIKFKDTITQNVFRSADNSIKSTVVQLFRELYLLYLDAQTKQSDLEKDLAQIKDANKKKEYTQLVNDVEAKIQTINDEIDKANSGKFINQVKTTLDAFINSNSIINEAKLVQDIDKDLYLQLSVTDKKDVNAELQKLEGIRVKYNGTVTNITEIKNDLTFVKESVKKAKDILNGALKLDIIKQKLEKINVDFGKLGNTAQSSLKGNHQGVNTVISGILDEINNNNQEAIKTYLKNIDAINAFEKAVNTKLQEKQQNDAKKASYLTEKDLSNAYDAMIASKEYKDLQKIINGKRYQYFDTDDQENKQIDWLTDIVRAFLINVSGAHNIVTKDSDDKNQTHNEVYIEYKEDFKSLKDIPEIIDINTVGKLDAAVLKKYPSSGIDINTLIDALKNKLQKQQSSSPTTSIPTTGSAATNTSTNSSAGNILGASATNSPLSPDHEIGSLDNEEAQNVQIQQTVIDEKTKEKVISNIANLMDIYCLDAIINYLKTGNQAEANNVIIKMNNVKTAICSKNMSQIKNVVGDVLAYRLQYIKNYIPYYSASNLVSKVLADGYESNLSVDNLKRSVIIDFLYNRYALDNNFDFTKYINSDNILVLVQNLGKQLHSHGYVKQSDIFDSVLYKDETKTQIDKDGIYNMNLAAIVMRMTDSDQDNKTSIYNTVEDLINEFEKYRAI